MKRFFAMLAISLTLGATVGATIAKAHSGRTDKNGCHVDKKQVSVIVTNA